MLINLYELADNTDASNNPYKILGVSTDASQETIKTARKHKLSEAFSNGDSIVPINVAYSIIGNPSQRLIFDMFGFCDMNEIVKADNELGSIYLGSKEAAVRVNKLKELNINYIVTVAKELEHIQLEDHGFKQLHVPLEDAPIQIIEKSILPGIFEFINEGRKNSNVLIHCAQGVSRSASILAAYMVHDLKIDTEAAVAIIKEKRPIADPPNYFLDQIL